MDADAIHWNALYEDGAGPWLLHEETREEMESFTPMKMDEDGTIEGIRRRARCKVFLEMAGVKDRINFPTTT